MRRWTMVDVVGVIVLGRHTCGLVRMCADRFCPARGAGGRLPRARLASSRFLLPRGSARGVPPRRGLGSLRVAAPRRRLPGERGRVGRGDEVVVAMYRLVVVFRACGAETVATT
nr:hypothetical protein CFP56_04264 [Quercus suber]